MTPPAVHRAAGKSGEWSALAGDKEAQRDDRIRGFVYEVETGRLREVELG